MQSQGLKVSVVGAGIMGLLTALEFSDAGIHVDLFDAGQPGMESSWAGGGIVSPLYPWRYSPAVTSLASWAQDFYPEFASRLSRDTGIDPEFDRWGLLMLDAQDHKTALEWAQAHGKRMILMEGARLADVEPGANIDVEHLLYMPEVGSVRNPRLVRSALALLTQSSKVTLHPCSAVTGLCLQGGVATGVKTANGTYPSDGVVVCSGAWTSRLLGDLVGQLPISPVRGQMIAFQSQADVLRHILLRDGTYLIPRRGGLVLAGSTLEFVGFDKSVTLEAREWLSSRAIAMLPSLKEAKWVGHWSGLRPGSPDGIPWIGPWPGIRGLFVNAGHYRNGLVLAPAAARLLADIVLQRPLSVHAPACLPVNRLEVLGNNTSQQRIAQSS